jgi:hypothetical protein
MPSERCLEERPGPPITEDNQPDAGKCAEPPAGPARAQAGELGTGEPRLAQRVEASLNVQDNEDENDTHDLGPFDPRGTLSLQPARAREHRYSFHHVASLIADHDLSLKDSFGRVTPPQLAGDLFCKLDCFLDIDALMTCIVFGCTRTLVEVEVEPWHRTRVLFSKKKEPRAPDRSRGSSTSSASLTGGCGRWFMEQQR